MSTPNYDRGLEDGIALGFRMAAQVARGTARALETSVLPHRVEAAAAIDGLADAFEKEGPALAKAGAS